MYAPQILGATLPPVDAPGCPPMSIWRWGDDEVDIGIWECEPGVLEGPPPDADAMMFMVAGRATMSHDDGDPHESTNTLWAHNHLEMGVWECTPGTFGARRDGFDEVFVCLSGRATLTDASGVRFDLSPGSALYTPSGFTGTWRVTETFRKVFCIINDR